MAVEAQNQQLIDSVRFNCNLADARHAGNYTMCIYLLKMREFFRWEAGYELTDSLPREEIGRWLGEREALWESLDDEEFRPLSVEGRSFDPFAAHDINQRLLDHNLVYGAGIGPGGRPLFFLADLEQVEIHSDYRILVCGREYARDLTAPAAMAQGQTIYVRSQSLRRMLWEKIEQWRWSRADNAMGKAIACYDFETDEVTSLDQMAERETQSVIWHEIGEVMVTEQVGPAWAERILALPRCRAELQMRAVRDNLADCLSTLPRLISDGHEASLHFYFGSLDGFRRELSPTLVNAYDGWCHHGDLGALETVVAAGADHWLALIREVLTLPGVDGQPDASAIEELISSKVL
jgi:hypothetical protein